MNFKKLISLFLAVLMLCSVLTSYSVIIASAEDASEETTDEENDLLIEDYISTVYASPEEKLATMKLKTTKGNYAIYADEKSGEVAVKDLSSGQIQFTNPYDIGAATASDSVKKQIMSQIIVKFSDNGREREYSSYEYAALRDQIKVKNIKNGIRVEYTIGREEARRLVPRMIEKSRFEELIQAPMEEYYGVSYEDAKVYKDQSGHPLQSASFYLCKQMSYFVYKSLEEASSDRLKQDLLKTFPIVEKMDIYVLDPTAKTTEIEKIEEVIKTACPNYSYEDMDYDHQLTEYVSEDENPPVFKMALEYTLEEDGFTVRLPANGIRFNESKFQLTNLSILPYMGAGNNAYEGYTFYPDGSGALFAFEDLADQNTYSVASKIYGVDYAYHKITGTYQQTVSYPVFGIVENTRYYECTMPDEASGEDVTTTISGVIYDAVMKAKETGTATAVSKAYNNLVNNSDITAVTQNRGFVAIIEEGDGLTELVNYHAGVLSPYDTVQMNFNPRPKDSYNVADAISVGSNSEWTVVSNRKYVGNYKIHYIMLTDETISSQETFSDDSYYDASWLGMAFAYRDYLVNKGVLNKLTAEQTSGDIPLYIESFGAMEVTEKIMSIPVEVMRPLTSAQDVITMYEELSAAGATNINFKLTGYANGGMWSTMPYGLKWEKAVQDEKTMQELFDYAAGVTDGNLGLFPDFDFSYVSTTKLFDGLSTRKHAVRTIDDRLSFKREYVATQQKYMGYYYLAISPAYFSHFYEKLMKNYLKYDNVTGISVGTLGNALNSDFDEDEPYNREDSKSFVQQALEYISGGDEGTLEVMVDGGNAYTWKYVDHILDVALDSSRYIKASYSVPFIGVVLHGYMNFAGSPLNMEGDVNYAKLKAIENGASVYFTLSYQNTQSLKESYYLSKYYSIRYDIWFDDVVELYNELNSELKDVQDKIIIDHQFLSGTRVPDTDELDRDITEEFNAVLDFQINKAEYEIKQKAESVADARDQIASVEVAAKNFVSNCLTYYSGISGAAYMYVTGDRSYERRFASYMEAKAAYDDIMAQYTAADEAGKAELASKVSLAEATHKQALGQLRTYIRNVGRAIETIMSEYTALTQLLEDAKSGAILINNTEGCPQSIIDEIAVQLANTERLMAEQLGLNFNLTVDKAEVDTFIYTHISTLLYSAYGESSHNSIGVVGKAENLYEMLANEDYGLLITELDTIRYLAANRDLTDDQLIAKYGLSENRSSMNGLVLYISELLGESYSFDPIIAAMANGVEENIRDYFESILYAMVTGLGDSSVVPSLNFVPTRKNDNGRLVSNTTNINKVTGLINDEISKLLTGKTGVIANVTDGNYKLYDLITEEQMQALVAKAVEIINDNIKTPTNVSPKYPVEYVTPDTMETDIRHYIEGVYYKAVIAQIAPDDAGNVKLEVLTVSTQTNSSISLLVSLRMNAYDYEADTKYEDLVKAMKADTELAAMLDTINNAVKGAYGDVRDSLEKAFISAFATKALGKDKAPTLEKVSVKDADDNKRELRVEAEALVNARLTADSTLAEVEALIADLIALHSDYADALPDGYDPTAPVTTYVYYQLLSLMSKVTLKETENYYYDEQMATMDAAVRAAVEAKKAEILADLPENYDVFDIYEKVFASLADKENSVYDLAASIAGNVSHTASGKASLEDDVLAYYIYLLINSFEGYDLGAEPGLSVEGNATFLKNALTIVHKDLEDRIPLLLAQAKAAVGRGEMPDYALTGFLTEDEITAIGNELVDALIKALFAKEEQRETLLPEVISILKYNYYVAVLDKLNADELPTLHVSEIYGNTLYDAALSLKELMYYNLIHLAGMTEKQIDDLIKTGGSMANIEEDDDEVSRYISNDGRIVSVTYGEKNADGTYTAYKTFILNYNNFSVNVDYGPELATEEETEAAKVTYTIPAYGYVVVMH